MNQNIQTHLEKLKTELSKLEPAVKHLQYADKNTTILISVSKKLTLLLKSVLKLHKDLIESNERLIDEIDKVDFPTRLDKIDATVSAINQGLQNVQTRIGDLERNLKDYIQSGSREIIARIEALDKTMTAQFKKQTKENKLLKFLLFISIGLSIAIIIIHFIK